MPKSTKGSDRHPGWSRREHGKNATFGYDFNFSGGLTARAAALYTRTEGATPLVHRTSPEHGMQGADLEIWGERLDAAIPVLDKNWYVQDPAGIAAPWTSSTM